MLQIGSYCTFQVGLLALFKLSSKNSSDDNATSSMLPWDYVSLLPHRAAGQKFSLIHLFF